MTVRVDWKFEMEYYLRTWSNLDVKGEGTWQVCVEDLATEFSESDFKTFDEFLDEYFHSFRGLDLDSALLIHVDEEDFAKLEQEVKGYLENEAI